MDKIEIIEKSKDESTYRILSLVFGIAILILGLKDLSLIKIVLGLLLIFYFTYHKKIYITKSGIMYIYKGFLLNRTEVINFKDIEEITFINKNNTCIMFLIKEPMARKVMVDYDKMDQAINFIKNNTKIPIELNQ